MQKQPSDAVVRNGDRQGQVPADAAAGHTYVSTHVSTLRSLSSEIAPAKDSISLYVGRLIHTGRFDMDFDVLRSRQENLQCISSRCNEVPS